MLVGGLTIYAWKDWFVSLCGLIVLAALLESGDIPKNIAGIQGLNLWNILLFSVLAAWLCQRRMRHFNKWNMPRHITVLLLIYMGIILVGFFRALFDRELLGISLEAFISDELINTIKWVVPGLLLFEGCRTHKRMKLAIASILLMLLLISLQVYRVSPLEGLVDAQRLSGSRLKFDRRVGYNAVDVAAMLSGAFWGFIAFTCAFRAHWKRIALFLVALSTLGSLALTGGRAGFVTWAIVGLAMCLLRWRKHLILLPLGVALMYMAFPGPLERIMEGFGQVSPAGRTHISPTVISSGRSLIWPPVVEKIEEAPMLGYGRAAMMRTKITHYLLDWYGEREAVSHPHNIYLEWTLDNGIVGLLPVLTFFGIVLVYSARLLRSASPWAVAVGGITFSLVLAQLIAGLGSQHFYPTEGNMAMWSAIFLMFQAYIVLEKRKAAMSTIGLSSAMSGSRSSASQNDQRYARNLRYAGAN